MGIIIAPKRCFITDLPTQNIPSEIYGIDYHITISGKQYHLSFGPNHVNSEYVEKNKYILKGLFFNNIFPFSPANNYYDNKRLEEIIIEAQVPDTPKSKLDNLILFLQNIQEYPGAQCDFKKAGGLETILHKLYFKNNEEYWFYLKTLKEEELISFTDVSSKDGYGAINIRLTFKGLNYLIELEEKGIISHYCFIAMSFSDSQKEVREVIKKVVRETGYEPLLVDELHYESEMTINDAMLKFIKMSKFLIADFTEQRHGVYFEAGFALGLKRKVIYLCKDTDFENSHFDINHYPHLVYKNLNELEMKLKDKILAWIV